MSAIDSNPISSTFQVVSGNIPLGINGSIASLSEKKSLLSSPVVLRFYLQSLARELLMGEAVAKCLRVRFKELPLVQVIKNAHTGKTRFGSLQTCKSVWHCPVCAARISEGRRQELAAALPDAHLTNPDGEKVPLFAALITFTFQHNKSMSCASSVQGVLAAYRRLKSGKGYQSLKDEYGLVGSVRALEVTYGEKNGWHPHIHELMLFNRPMTDAMLHGLSKDLKSRWRSVLSKEGLDASLKHGVDVDYRNDGDMSAAVLEYVSKFGHAPKETGWTITHELTKSGSKKSGGDGHFSMLELLEKYGNGDVLAGRLWREYAMTMKGRNQLVWSRGLRDLLGLGVEKTDGELVDDEKETDAERILAALDPDQWKAVLKADLRGEILVQANTLNEADFSVWLADKLSRWMSPAAGRQVRLTRASDGSYKVV